MTSHLLLALLLTAGTACYTAREGSVLVIDSGSRDRTNAPPIVAAANGATAQHSGNHSDQNAKGQGSLAVSRGVWIWIAIGAGVVLLGWFLWKFVFTGARVALIHGP